MENEIETAIMKHSLKVKMAVMKVLGIVDAIILAISIYLIRFTERDGITTSTGHSVSWDIYPYKEIGTQIEIVSVLSMIFIVMYYLYLKNKSNKYI